MNLVYQHYGVTNLHYVSEDVGHRHKTYDKMVPGLKQIYLDLGYVSETSEFNANETDYEKFGSWKEFDQNDFVDIGFSFLTDDSWWEDMGKVYIPNNCYVTTCRLHLALHGCRRDPDYHARISSFN